MNAKIKIQVVSCITFVAVVLFFPFSTINYIQDLNGVIRLSRIDRKSCLMIYGTFFTPGYFENRFFMPDLYISPEYEYMTPFDRGCFELAVEFREDIIIMYRGTYCRTKNLNKKFQLIDLPNAFGELNWFVIQEDTSGKYLELDCRSGLVD